MMKKTLFGLLICLSASNLYAGPDEKRGRSIEALTEKLALSAEQAETLEVILNDHREKHLSLGQENREQNQQLRQDFEAQLQTVLTEEQFNQFIEQRGNRPKRHRRGKRNRDANPS